MYQNSDEEKYKKGGKCVAKCPKYAMGGTAKVRLGQCSANGSQKMLKKNLGRNK